VILVYTNILQPPIVEGLEMVPVCGPKADVDPAVRRMVTGIVVVLQAFCYTNSSVNPILYAMLSENFKKSFAAACCGRRAEMERMSVPEPSIYTRSRHLAGSIRRKFLAAYVDEDGDDEDSPETLKTDASSRRATENTPTIQVPSVPITRNGSIKSSTSNGSSNGYRLVFKCEDDEDAV
jgi:hypothetical protein